MRHASARTTLDTLDRLNCRSNRSAEVCRSSYSRRPRPAMSCALLRYDAGFIRPGVAAAYENVDHRLGAAVSGSSHADR